MKEIKLVRILFFLFLCNTAFCHNIPKLKSGENLRDILMESGKYRWSSGFSILEFRVNEEGNVDSVIVTSTYFARDTLGKQIDRRDLKEMKSLKFLPQKKSVWVQCKVYKYLYNNRVMDIDNPSKVDAMRMFNYGLEELWENEIKTFFTDSEGELKDFLFLNGRIIVAPVYVYGIT